MVHRIIQHKNTAEQAHTAQEAVQDSTQYYRVGRINTPLLLEQAYTVYWDK